MWRRGREGDKEHADVSKRTAVKTQAGQQRLDASGAVLEAEEPAAQSSVTPFRSLDAFLRELEERGVGMMELVSMTLKSQGRMLSRTLSFDKCEFQKLDIPLSSQASRTYDASACWRGGVDLASIPT